MLVAALCGGWCATTALAEDRPRTTVLKTTVSDSGLEGLGGAVERLARTRLDGLGVVRTAGTPGLGLSDLQLAVGCVGDTPACLRAVAQQLEVDALLLSSVDRAGDELVLTFTFFDSRDGSSTGATRRASGETAETTLLDGVEGALREVFDLPPPAEPAPSDVGPPPDGQAGGATGTPTTGPDEPQTGGGGISPIGITVGAAGIVALAVGTGFAIKAGNTEDDYAGMPIATTSDVDEALDLLDDADRQAKIANAMFGIGTALVATGTLLLFVLRPGGEDEGAPQVALAPVVSPGAAGVVLSGQLGEER